MRVDFVITRGASGKLAVLFLSLFLAIPVLWSQEKAAPEEVAKINDVKFLAEQAALDSLKGPDPFVLREAYWSGTIEPGQTRLIQTQLFKRNEYQFWLAVPARGARVQFNLYDSQGQMVTTESKYHGSDGVVSVYFAPPASGMYYLRMHLQPTVETGQDWVLLYSYR